MRIYRIIKAGTAEELTKLINKKLREYHPLADVVWEVEGGVCIYVEEDNKAIFAQAISKIARPRFIED